MAELGKPVGMGHFLQRDTGAERIARNIDGRATRAIS
jgi:hypothetical protein